MTITISGVDFDHDAKSFDVDDDFVSTSRTVSGFSNPRSSSPGRAGRQLSFEIPIITTDPQNVVQRLNGLTSENDLLLIEASDQHIVGNHQEVYLRRANVQERKEPGRPTLSRVTVTGEIAGIPLFTGGNSTKVALLGGTYEPTEWDTVYFSLINGSHKGRTPSSTFPIEWDERDADDWTDTRGSFVLQRYDDGNWTIKGGDNSGDNLSVWTGDTNIDNDCWQANVLFDDDVDGDVSLLYRMQGTAVGDAGYRVRLKSSEIALERRTGDDTYTSVSTYTFSPKANVWYNIAIAGTGSRLRVFLDGDLVIDAAESNHSSGRVGIAYDGNTNDVYFRELLSSDSENPRVTSVPIHREATVIGSQEEADDYLPTGDNLLTNPGFENDSSGDSSATSWTDNNSLTVSIKEDSILGTLGCELQGSDAFLSQQVNINRRTTYVISCWVKQSTAGGTPKLEVTPINGSGDTLSTQSANTNDLWQRLQLVLTPDNSKNTTTYEVRLYPSGAEIGDETAVFDDVTVKTATPFVKMPLTDAIEYADAVGDNPTPPAISTVTDVGGIGAGFVGEFSVSAEDGDGL